MVNAGVDQAEGLRQRLAFSRARSIAIVAGARGAGATTTVVNLACALAERGRRVLVIDENRGANAAQALAVEPRQDLHDVMTDACAL